MVPPFAAVRRRLGTALARHGSAFAILYGGGNRLRRGAAADCMETAVNAVFEVLSFSAIVVLIVRRDRHRRG